MYKPSWDFFGWVIYYSKRCRAHTDDKVFQDLARMLEEYTGREEGVASVGEIYYALMREIPEFSSKYKYGKQFMRSLLEGMFGKEHGMMYSTKPNIDMKSVIRSVVIELGGTRVYEFDDNAKVKERLIDYPDELDLSYLELE